MQTAQKINTAKMDLLGTSTTLEESFNIPESTYSKYDFLLFKVNVKSNGTELYRSNQILIPTIEFSLADEMPSSQFSVCCGDYLPDKGSANIMLYLILNKSTCCSYWWARYSNQAQSPNLSYVCRVYGIKI